MVKLKEVPVNIEAALQSAEKDDNGRVSCNTCGKTFSKKSNLNAHVKSFHNLAKWECPELPGNVLSKNIAEKTHIEKTSQAGETTQTW